MALLLGWVTSGSLLQMLGPWLPVLVGFLSLAPSLMADSSIMCEYSLILGLGVRTALRRGSSS